MPRRSVRPRHAVAGVAGALLGALLVSLVFFRLEWTSGPSLVPRFDLGAFVRRLPEHSRWLPGFFALAVSLFAWRALVWRIVAPPPRPRYRDAYHATALGALVHNTVPGKLGPLAAAFVLSRSSREPFAAALSSQLVAKLLEMGAVVLLGAAAAWALPRVEGIGRAVIAGAAVFTALAATAAGTALVAPRAGARIARRLPRAGAALAALGAGLTGVGSPARLGLALLAAVAPAVTAALAYTVPLAAFGVGEGVAGGAVLVAVITFGQLTPGLPVGTGVYWSLAAWGARRLGATPDDAAALAVLTHAAMVVASIVVGAVSAIARRGALRELLRRRREVADLAARAERAAEASTDGHSRTPT
jgi:hypothetical protein